ncbi:hypothetical protein M9H77_03965 [Catharanthus roseus]|uniref:Uncharacterized protein n=1 Tax=Catharanthus roseus TaxID=4058 RepID=A0ACC0CD20_CATRO|nr:hypothetical protein M9H77_03965 [Catharanthus roseus]
MRCPRKYRLGHTLKKILIRQSSHAYANFTIMLMPDLYSCISKHSHARCLRGRALQTRHPPSGHLKALSCQNLKKLKKRLDKNLRTKGEIFHYLRKLEKKHNHQRQRIFGKQEFTR